MVILAKPNESLIEHTENTLKVFKSIKESYVNVPEICGVPDFWEHLFYSLFFHDFGKAAVGFQESLKSNKYWDYRHEILSRAKIAMPVNEYSRLTIFSCHFFSTFFRFEDSRTMSSQRTISVLVLQCLGLAICSKRRLAAICPISAGNWLMELKVGLM